MAQKYATQGRRCPGHDYRARCIYHVVMAKPRVIAPYSRVIGNSRWHPGATENPLAPPEACGPPRIELWSNGQAIAQALQMVVNEYPNIRIITHCIMPDHIHLVIFVTKATEAHLGDIIRRLKVICSELTGGLRLFEEGYHDTFLDGEGQLNAWL